MGDRNELEGLFYKDLSHTIGEIDYNMVNPRIVKYLDGKTFIMKVDNEGLSKAVLALSLMRRLGQSEQAFYTLLSSGTIKALLKGYGKLSSL